jgi:hypothetical protein
MVDKNKEMEKIIKGKHKIIKTFRRKYNIPERYEAIYDLESIFFDALAETQLNYKEEKGAFTTYFWLCFRNKIINETKKHKVKRRKHDWIYISNMVDDDGNQKQIELIEEPNPDDFNELFERICKVIGIKGLEKQSLWEFCVTHDRNISKQPRQIDNAITRIRRKAKKRGLTKIKYLEDDFSNLKKMIQRKRKIKVKEE